MQDQLEPILQAWAAWQRDKTLIYRLCGINGSWLGRIVKKRQKEISGDSTAILEYSDDVMLIVDALVRQLPRSESRVIIEHYTGPAHWTIEQRMKRLNIKKSRYCQLLKSGREILISAIPWQEIPVYA